MMFAVTGFLWSIVTSDVALGFDGLLLLAALVVGFAPLLKYLPVIGPYVPVAKVAAVVISLSMCFLLGFRVADERQTSNNLRAIIAAQKADLETANDAAEDANLRSTQIEAKSDAQHETDAKYIASLAARPSCALDDGDIGNAGGVRVVPRRPFFRSKPAAVAK